MLQLCGRLGFVENQIFGRAAKQSIHTLVEFAYFSGGDLLSNEVESALRSLKDMIEFGADHNISALSCLTFVILTDACYELGKAGLGGVLVGPTGRFIEYFSYYLSPEELEILGTHEKEMIIHECEMIAVSASLIKWESKVLGAQVIFCLDNDGTRTPYALGPRTLLIFGHGCSGDPMLLEHERHSLRELLWFGLGCSHDCVLLEHERYYGLGMDALMTACSWRTNVIMVWAWMLKWPYALGTRTLLWFWRGCSGDGMLLEHERNYSSGMEALMTVCSWRTNGIMAWAWMLW